MRVPDISVRKKEHLDLAAGVDAASTSTPGWDDVHLLAASIPRIALADVDLSVELLGHRIEAPFVIAAMTGGHDEAVAINENLAVTAEELKVAIGSGSQRAALRHPELARTYSIIRESAPNAVVLANIGIFQLIDQVDSPALTQAEIETAVGMLDAQFLVVHLNALEEAIQPEGDSRAAGLIDALAELTSVSPVPVIAKETGAGMTRETAGALVQAGISMIDVGGAGGTSFARIEGQRAAMRGDMVRARLGKSFSGWGIPTASSILEVVPVGLPVIATGGIRNGIHAAKALRLGATAVGVAGPMLKAALDGPEAAKRELSAFVDELRLATHLSGCVDLVELAEQQTILTGHTRAWAEQRGLI